jgi:NADPH-dependent ferric siderophore reductase
MSSTVKEDCMPRERVRHDMAFRRAHVLRRTQLTPLMVRVTLGGGELAGFAAPGPSDHVKLYFPDPATGVVTAPSLTPDGVHRPDDAVIISRDFTPRAFRADGEDGPELDIDFVLHGDAGPAVGGPAGGGANGGPASAWAARCRSGDELVVAGPRGSHLIPHDASHVVLIADETALPAFSRWLELLPPAVRISGIVELADEDGDAYLSADLRRRANIEWLYRIDGPGQLDESLRSIDIADDDYVWGAGEATALIPLRRYLKHERGLAADRVAIEGYWKRGVTNLDHHAPLDPSDP